MFGTSVIYKVVSGMAQRCGFTSPSNSFFFPFQTYPQRAPVPALSQNRYEKAERRKRIELKEKTNPAQNVSTETRHIPRRCQAPLDGLNQCIVADKESVSDDMEEKHGNNGTMTDNLFGANDGCRGVDLFMGYYGIALSKRRLVRDKFNPPHNSGSTGQEKSPGMHAPASQLLQTVVDQQEPGADLVLKVDNEMQLDAELLLGSVNEQEVYGESIELRGIRVAEVPVSNGGRFILSFVRHEDEAAIGRASGVPILDAPEPRDHEVMDERRLVEEKDAVREGDSEDESAREVEYKKAELKDAPEDEETTATIRKEKQKVAP